MSENKAAGGDSKIRELIAKAESCQQAIQDALDLLDAVEAELEPWTEGTETGRTDRKEEERWAKRTGLRVLRSGN